MSGTSSIGGNMAMFGEFCSSCHSCVNYQENFVQCKKTNGAMTSLSPFVIR